jgi:hypothetical protein
MANDIKAVKRYNQDAAANAVLSNSTISSNDTNSELEFMFDCDYIEYVHPSHPVFDFY